MSEFKWIDTEKNGLPTKSGDYLCWIVRLKLEGFFEDGTPIIDRDEYARVVSIVVYASDGSIHPVITGTNKIVAWAEIPEVPDDILKNNGGEHA